MKLILASLFFISSSASAAVFQNSPSEYHVDFVECSHSCNGINYSLKIFYKGDLVYTNGYGAGKEPREIYNRFLQALDEGADIYYDTEKELLTGFKVMTRNFTCPQ